MNQNPPNPNSNPNSYPNYWGTTPEEEYYTQQGIKCTKSFYTTPTTNQTLFTRSWVPLSNNNNNPPRGIICMVHGYGNDISWTFQGTPIYLAQNGFACFALDLPGHGKSDGLKAFVPNVDHVVSDCISYFNSIMDDHNYVNLPCFLFGESMGGAICLLISLKVTECLGNRYKGAILIAPMCRISDNVRPKWPIPEILTMVGKIMPKLAIVPTPDLLDKSVKVPEKKAIAVLNPLRYNGKPRLGTVIELLRVTDYLTAKLKDVSIPFVVLHGSADGVTDPNVSRELYEEARSEDKTIKIYEGMLHSLLFGETDENVALVRNDILGWLTERCS
ncbi:caffeoylshikimate esterase [Silene latifolia]|uniref:caffeoylshikimate esterase n=1 Tax=Silene latifolia TaxID=37657 RepID=UPI003D77BA90